MIEERPESQKGLGHHLKRADERLQISGGLRGPSKNLTYGAELVACTN